ncbi:MAG: YceI family protein [Flavobacteriales bacterium]|nr:YceI family protein [Flavobacteriales bacterium]
MKKRFISFVITALISAMASAQHWNVKSDAVSIEFKIKNFGVWVKGSFSGLQAHIHFDKNRPETSSITATLDASSVNTGIQARDNHLRKEEFFDVKNYPTISYQSAFIKKKDDKYEMTGTLTMKGVAKTIVIPFIFIEDGGKGVFRASFDIDRTEFGVGAKSGPMGKIVKLEVSVAVIAGHH